MKIQNLNYIEPIVFTDEKVQTINGGSGTLVSVSGSAVAYGDEGSAWLDADVKAMETSPDGGSVSIGRLTAFAYGDEDASVDVSGEAYGDIAIVTAVEPDPAPQNLDLGIVVAVGVETGV